MDDKKRCPWADSTDSMREYHDTIWGREEKDERKMFRMLVLEMFQSGLSWQTILNKEEYFDEAFDDFDIEKIASYDESKIEELVNNENIIRHRMKIEATINNANKVIEIQKKYGSFSKFIWRYVIDTPIINPWSEMEEVPSQNYLSDKITHDLKKIGFKFLGSTTIYSWLQAIGMINDHLLSCDFKYID